jgi:hypothetical protein
LFTLTTSRLQSQNGRCKKNKSIEERVASRKESKKEVDNVTCNLMELEAAKSDL